jgi:hypothetical protein
MQATRLHREDDGAGRGPYPFASRRHARNSFRPSPGLSPLPAYLNRIGLQSAPLEDAA